MMNCNKTQKTYAKYLLVLLVVLIAFSCFAITASAAVPKPAGAGQTMEDWDEYAEDRLNNPIKFSIYNMCKWKYIGTGWFVSLFDWLFNWNLSATAEMWITSVHTTTARIGMLICFVYFLLDLLEHATRDNFTAEIFVKQFAKLIIMFILFEPSNLQIISDFGSALNGRLFAAIEDSLDTNAFAGIDALIEELKGTSWLKCVFMLFSINDGIPGLVQLLVIIASLFVGVGRLVEVLIYRAMLPLGMASIYNGGVHSSGFRYIKKCIALEIQGAIMFAVFVGSSFINIALTPVPGLGIIIDVALGVATMAVVARSKQIANDVVGV